MRSISHPWTPSVPMTLSNPGFNTFWSARYPSEVENLAISTQGDMVVCEAELAATHSTWAAP